ncbi:putative armadillo-like helical, protein ARABIDILLO [Helianthus debilis subsp. tardiflorus]|nr:putative armadillo-like helical, protein ARABIDILLO [Helianthus annuus]
MSLTNVLQLRFLSVAGTTDIDCDSTGENLTSLPYLEGLDESRTDVDPENFTRLVVSIDSLIVVCAFNCPVLEEDPAVYNSHGKMTLGFSNDTFKVLSSMFPDTKNEQAVFSNWRNGSNKNEANLDDLMSWVEWILSHALLRIAEANLTGLISFDSIKEQAVKKGGGVQLLLRLARSLTEGLQLEATKAIANLSANPAFARSVAGEGGITVLASLAKSTNRFVAEEAAGGLWNLSAGDKHMERAAGALADLVADEKYSMEVAAVGALVATMANLTSHGDSNTNNVMVGQEDGVINVLILLIGSQHDAVRQEAATAFWHLSNDARNRERIALHGGVEALV